MAGFGRNATSLRRGRWFSHDVPSGHLTLVTRNVRDMEGMGD